MALFKTSAMNCNQPSRSRWFPIERIVARRERTPRPFPEVTVTNPLTRPRVDGLRAGVRVGFMGTEILIVLALIAIPIALLAALILVIVKVTKGS